MKKFALIFVAILSLVWVGGAVATGQGWDPHFNWIDHYGALSNQIANKSDQVVPYPGVNDLNWFAERAALREKLLRENTPGKLGYVYVTTISGKIYGYYTIVGPVVSTQSQMTATEQTYNHNNSAGLASSIGDNGTYGPEQGGPNGIFFFTTNGVMVITDNDYIYSDAPLPLTGVPNLSPTQKPSTVSKYYKPYHKK